MLLSINLSARECRGRNSLALEILAVNFSVSTIRGGGHQQFRRQNVDHFHGADDARRAPVGDVWSQINTTADSFQALTWSTSISVGCSGRPAISLVASWREMCTGSSACPTDLKSFDITSTARKVLPLCAFG